MFDDEDDEETDSPLRFKEILGEHSLTEDVRMAFIWATIVRFLSAEERGRVPPVDFTDKQRQLSKSVIFHGPFEDHNLALKESLRRRGIAVAYLPSWSEKYQPVWIVCLAH